MSVNIRDRMRDMKKEVRKPSSYDRLVEGWIDDIDYFGGVAAQCLDLLNKVISHVRKTPSGDYYIMRKGAMVLVPAELNDALKDIEAYLGSVE